ncbi:MULTISPECIES: CDP-glucose 4,6-dehydratase [unclassified Neptuniibacter]|uniref:CDP-glucose 4,6-dehydratase n=1 Tax=unclassified Neptuniibacter TaxID=2630693 RepID=UPI000C5FE4FD|nr:MULTISPECIES: CDP-glucose 4,6-dehydratase [unclassified Neptuniibacter]MAY40960.1 CDP-glucose 4,6-dehydratase [Oceanospirillaceae bacterium]|tara:strand:+ start:17766 stop:18827 length:1062 start_codon:yes stop_codon:yes gene_type:complete
MEITVKFWKGKKVFITGHTGFKGSWLTLWLKELGADICGYSLIPPTTPNFFSLANINTGITSHIADIRDLTTLKDSLRKSEAEIVIHFAAQPLVRKSYQEPIETYTTNVLGTVNILEAARNTSTVRCILNITSDKCYENIENNNAFTESDPMGGHDPYSASKGCSELITSSYSKSFFEESGVILASARAGNVIGGGDWAQDRLIPDIIQAFSTQQNAIIRSPNATRPWQHVLEPLSGYLILCEAMYRQDKKYAGPWNFGPHKHDIKPVKHIVKELSNLWGENAVYTLQETSTSVHEAQTLRLDCTKAIKTLNWQPKWTIEQALSHTVSWYKAYSNDEDIRAFTLKQIQKYCES